MFKGRPHGLDSSRNSFLGSVGFKLAPARPFLAPSWSAHTSAVSWVQGCFLILKDPCLLKLALQPVQPSPSTSSIDISLLANEIWIGSVAQRETISDSIRLSGRRTCWFCSNPTSPLTFNLLFSPKAIITSLDSVATLRPLPFITDHIGTQFCYWSPTRLYCVQFYYVEWWQGTLYTILCGTFIPWWDQPRVDR